MKWLKKFFKIKKKTLLTYKGFIVKDDKLTPYEYSYLSSDNNEILYEKNPISLISFNPECATLCDVCKNVIYMGVNMEVILEYDQSYRRKNNVHIHKNFCNECAEEKIKILNSL